MIYIRNYDCYGREIRAIIFIHAYVLAMTFYVSYACGTLLKSCR